MKTFREIILNEVNFKDIEAAEELLKNMQSEGMLPKIKVSAGHSTIEVGPDKSDKVRDFINSLKDFYSNINKYVSYSNYDGLEVATIKYDSKWHYSIAEG
jgi:hypothetical protein